MVRIHRTRSYIRFIALLLLLLILPVFGDASMLANAEEEVHTVYVSSAEVEGERDGSRERPYAQLYDAFLALSNHPDPESNDVSKAKSGGCIVVLDRVVVADANKKSLTVTLPAHANPITVTGEEGAELIFKGSAYYCSLLLGGKTVFDDILLRAETHCTISANGYDLTFTERFKSNIKKGSLYVSGSNYGVTRIYGGTFSTVWATDAAGCVPDEKEGIEAADSVLLFGKNATVTGMLFGAGAARSFTGSVLLILEGGKAGHVYGGGQNIPFYGDTQIWIAGNVSATVNGGGVGSKGKVHGKRYIYEMVSAPNSHYLPENFDVWMGVKETATTETYSQGVVVKSYSLYLPEGSETESEEEISGLCALPIVNGKSIRLFRVDQDGLHRVFYTRIYGYFSFKAIPGEYVLLETGELTGVEDVIPSVKVEEDERTPGEIITDTAAPEQEYDEVKKDTVGLGIGWIILIILSVMAVLIAAALFLFHKGYVRYHRD